MQVLFAIQEPYLPESTGGGLLDIDGLATQLQAQGVDVGVVATTERRDAATGSFGYPVVRVAGRGKLRRALGSAVPGRVRRALARPSARPVAARRIARAVATMAGPARADAVVVQGSGLASLVAAAAGSAQVVVVRLVTAGCVDQVEEAQRRRWFADAVADGRVRLTANSAFVAERCRSRTSLACAVGHPVMRLTSSHRPSGRHAPILFVNPVAAKGLEVALQVAALLPAQPFVFQESWPLPAPELDALRTRLASLPNVSLARRVASLDERYATSSLLLAPSQWQEAFGRVVVEAAAHGLPVVASRTGGIPEAAGDGGVLLDPGAPASQWADAIRDILGSEETYARFGAAARAHAASDRFAPAAVACDLVTLVRGSGRP